MSQQLNLLNPRLQRHRDFLSLHLVGAVVLAMLLVEIALASYAGYQRRILAAEELLLQTESKNLQSQVELASKTLAERKPSAKLTAEVQQFAAMLQPREEVLARLKATGEVGVGFSETLRGFSRQVMEGVWLTDFSASASDLTIRGRLVDAALLPGYVKRLNEEPAFKGRHFAALDMKGFEPPPVDTTAVPAPPPAKPVARVLPYVEFALQGSLSGASGTKSGGGN